MYIVGWLVFITLSLLGRARNRKESRRLVENGSFAAAPSLLLPPPLLPSYHESESDISVLRRGLQFNLNVCLGETWHRGREGPVDKLTNTYW